ncbi:MAG: hypothetical protein RB191_19555 [Terriglobia bacterium]|nr:hypothetical protein [Terriglobia bacterium]
MRLELRRLLFTAGIPICAMMGFSLSLEKDPSALGVIICWGAAFVAALAQGLFSFLRVGLLGLVDIFYSAVFLLAVVLSLNTIIFVMGYGHPFFFKP